MKEKFVNAYMDVAERFAQLSSARRLHVGAIVVKDDRIISIGYNGMPSGWDNNCEDESVELYSGHEGAIHRTVLKSKPEVLHAETNAIAKLAKSTESGDGAVLFVTHSPCLDCAKLIFQSGIRSVFYRDSYRSADGTTFLEKSGVEVTQVKKDS
jgi:dCMP deaminase